MIGIAFLAVYLGAQAFLFFDGGESLGRYPSTVTPLGAAIPPASNMTA